MLRNSNWRDAGAAERGGPENRYIRKGIGGSNPSPAEMSEVNFLFMSLIIKVCIFLQNPPDFFNLGWGEHLIMLSLEIF